MEEEEDEAGDDLGEKNEFEFEEQRRAWVSLLFVVFVHLPPP